MPPAPPTFSTMTVTPRSSERRGARMRPTRSPPPPAANGTTIVTGRVGQSCAAAGATSAQAIAAATRDRRTSLATDAARLDGPLPLLDLGGDELGEIIGATTVGRDDADAHVRETLLHARRVDGFA